MGASLFSRVPAANARIECKGDPPTSYSSTHRAGRDLPDGNIGAAIVRSYFILYTTREKADRLCLRSHLWPRHGKVDSGTISAQIAAARLDERLSFRMRLLPSIHTATADRLCLRSHCGQDMAKET